MPFTLNEESLLIKGRKGDTASFTFNFNKSMSDYTIHFYIKKNLNSSETLIEKKYLNPATPSVTVNLTNEDTGKFVTQANTYNTYYWGLKISNGKDFVQTVIPQEFKNPPMVYIYPEIGKV